MERVVSICAISREIYDHLSPTHVPSVSSGVSTDNFVPQVCREMVRPSCSEPRRNKRVYVPLAPERTPWWCSVSVMTFAAIFGGVVHLARLCWSLVAPVALRSLLISKHLLSFNNIGSASKRRQTNRLNNQQPHPKCRYAAGHH